MIEKLDISDVVRDHFATLTPTGTARPRPAEIGLHFGGPLLVGVVAYFVAWPSSHETVDLLVTADSILSALLLNLMDLIHSLPAPKIPVVSRELVQRLRRETHANVSFATLVALAAIIPLVIGSELSPESRLRAGINAVGVMLLTQLAMTLLMIIKRAHVMLTASLSEREKTRE